MFIRSFTQLALLSSVISCTSDTPEPSSRSTPPDTSVTRSSPTVAQLQPSDTGASQQPSGEPPPSAELLTADGWGPLRIGMSRAEVVAAAGEDASPGAVGGPDPERCDEFRPSKAPDGVLAMVESGFLTRISVSRTTGITTPAGFRIGDRGAGVLDEYGPHALVEPHQYWGSPAMYITVWRESPQEVERRGIRYEVDSDGTIIHLRAGGPSIEYVEGCV
jgi:hypothetical protein